MKDVNEINLEIERIHADIKLLEQSIDTIKNNHLAHIQDDVDRIQKELHKRGRMQRAAEQLIKELV